MTPNNLLFNHGCPTCNQRMSKGEQRIQKWLEDNNIKFQSQYVSKECCNKKPLKFDFAIYLCNSFLILCEYQGEQHYFPVRFSQNISDEEANVMLKNNILRDNIKKEYCKTHHIPLLEISYLDYSFIEKILEETIIKYREEALYRE